MPGRRRCPAARAAACTLSVRREMDALFGPEPKLVALHGAPGPVVERCAFQAKLGELVGDTVCPCEVVKQPVSDLPEQCSDPSLPAPPCFG